MHARIIAAPLDDEVDEAFERNPLPVPVGAPDGRVVRFVTDDVDHAEEVLEPEARAILGCPRVRLDVEEEIQPRRFGQAGESLVRLLRVWRDELPDQALLVLAPDLDGGLFPKPGKRAGIEVRHRLRWWQDGKRPTRPDAVRIEVLGRRPRQAGHDREVVVGPPPIGAIGVPGADLAVLDGVRVGGR